MVFFTLVITSNSIVPLLINCCAFPFNVQNSKRNKIIYFIFHIVNFYGCSFAGALAALFLKSHAKPSIQYRRKRSFLTSVKVLL